ncbi:hypothetical protein LINPERPRIM_LOCUS33694 [Linum perenne]
MPILDNSY